MQPKPCPVIFDLDGTLIHSNPEIAAAVNKVISEAGFARFSEAEIQSFVGNGLNHLVGLVCKARSIDASSAPELSRLILAEYITSGGKHSKLYPNVREALEALSSRGHPLAICTNKPLTATLENLKHFELEHLFVRVVGGDSFAERKPHHLPLLEAAQGLGEGAIFVGDSEVDEETAQRAGLPFLFFTGGYCKRPEHALTFAAKFDDFAELPKLIAKRPRVAG